MFWSVEDGGRIVAMGGLVPGTRFEAAADGKGHVLAVLVRPSKRR